MSDWNLPQLLSSLHADIESGLKTVRGAFGHPGTKGDASERVWLEMLTKYLPHRYRASKAHVVDSRGQFSEQIDVVIFDRQYSPFIFNYQGETVIPAESVYAVFEAKQAIDAEQVSYAQKKVASVRRLHRTSLPIPHAGGTHDAKVPARIMGGLLTFESDWKPALGIPLVEALHELRPESRGRGEPARLAQASRGRLDRHGLITAVGAGRQVVGDRGALLRRQRSGGALDQAFEHVLTAQRHGERTPSSASARRSLRSAANIVAFTVPSEHPMMRAIS